MTLYKNEKYHVIDKTIITTNIYQDYSYYVLDQNNCAIERVYVELGDIKHSLKDGVQLENNPDLIEVHNFCVIDIRRRMNNDRNSFMNMGCL